MWTSFTKIDFQISHILPPLTQEKNSLKKDLRDTISSLHCLGTFSHNSPLMSACHTRSTSTSRKM